MQFDLSTLDGFDWPASSPEPAQDGAFDASHRLDATASFDLQLALEQELGYMQSQQWDNLVDWANMDDAGAFLANGPGQEGPLRTLSELPAAEPTHTSVSPTRTTHSRPACQHYSDGTLQLSSIYPEPPFFPAFEDVVTLIHDGSDVNLAAASVASRGQPHPPPTNPGPQPLARRPALQLQAGTPSHPGKVPAHHLYAPAPQANAYPQPLSFDPFGPLHARLAYGNPSPPRVLTPARPLSIYVPSPGGSARAPPRHASLLPAAWVGQGQEQGQGHARQPEVTVYTLPAGPPRAAGAGAYAKQEGVPFSGGPSQWRAGGSGPIPPEYTLPSPALSCTSSSSSALSSPSTWLVSPRLSTHSRAHSSPILGSSASRRSLPLPLQRPPPSHHSDSAPGALPTFVLPSPPTTPRLSVAKPPSTAPSCLATARSSPELAQTAASASASPRSPATPKRARTYSAQGPGEDTPSPAKQGKSAVTPGTLARFKFVNFGESDGARLRAGVAPSGAGRKRN